jgi:hypothetical protein
MIWKYRCHIRRKIERVKLSVASERAEVTGRSFDRAAGPLVKANGGWWSLPATLPSRRS